MKIIFLVVLSGADESIGIGEERNVDDAVAVRYIDKGIAKAKNKKEYEKALKVLAEKEAEEEELKVKAYAILKQDELKESAEQLAKELQSTLELIEEEEFKSVLLLENFGIVSSRVEED